MQRTYLHIDLDAFFASVEQRDNPAYRGKPLIVGGQPGDRRSVVSTASYEARKYGVHSAMPLYKAMELCPQGIFIRGNHLKYEENSLMVMEVFSNFSPEVIQMSIDEAFIDITGTERLFGPPEEVAKKIKEQVYQKTRLTVSIGISSSMYVAKIASGLNKPNGLTVVPQGKEEEFMLSLPLEKLWGAGEKTMTRLKNAGFSSIRSIHSKSQNLLISIFGSGTGTFLYNAVRGNMDMRFGTDPKFHSISTETTFEYDLTDRYTIETCLMELSQNLLYRMHRQNARSRTVCLKIRYEDFSTVSIQETTERFISNADDMFERCKRLLSKKYDCNKGIRLLGVAVEKVEDKSLPVQQELFDFGDEKRARVENAIFDLEEKHPELKIRKARLIPKPDHNN